MIIGINRISVLFKSMLINRCSLHRLPFLISMASVSLPHKTRSVSREMIDDDLAYGAVVDYLTVPLHTVLPRQMLKFLRGRSTRTFALTGGRQKY